MNRIATTFQKYKSDGKKLIIPYITPEFPIRGSTVPLILALENAGAAMIEIGIPFSDPLADGPTIQHSSEIAIKNGANVHKIFSCVKEARQKTNIPLILMGYVNSLLNYGLEKFVQDAKASGVDGLIIPDLPPEESEDFQSICHQNGMSNIFLVAPTSSEGRIRTIDELSTDFTYCVSVTGVTGSRNSFNEDFNEFLLRIKKNTKKPFVIGFGIKNKEQIEQITKVADGVVVGSALLLAIRNKTTIDEISNTAAEFIGSLL